MINSFYKKSSFAFVFFVLIGMRTDAQEKTFSEMSSIEKTSLITALARGVTTFAAHATNNVGVKCVNDVTRIADTGLALYRQGLDFDAKTFCRLFEAAVSIYSINKNVNELIKKDVTKDLEKIERPKDFAIISKTAGLLFGILEGWQSARLVTRDSGTEEKNLVCTYENYKLTFLRLLENILVNSSLYQKPTDASKGQMLMWGGALTVNLDRVLNYGAYVATAEAKKVKS